MPEKKRLAKAAEKLPELAKAAAHASYYIDILKLFFLSGKSLPALTLLRNRGAQGGNRGNLILASPPLTRMEDGGYYSLPERASFISRKTWSAGREVLIHSFISLLWRLSVNRVSPGKLKRVF
jgi:hypothetical protein